MKKQGKTHTPTRGIKSKLLKIAAEYEEVETDFKKLEQETRFLNERVNKINRAYKVSVGWTTKYREALAEANRRLREAGLEEVRVITRTNDDDNEEEEYKQTSLF